MDEKSPFDLLSIYSLKCSVKEPSFCLKCESCKLIDKINCSKTWFTSLGYTQQKSFLEELIRLAPELLVKLPSILYGLQSKDYQYTKSRLKPSVSDDAFQSDTNHSLDPHQVDLIISDYLSWFKLSSKWSRTNFVLVLLQLCGTPLLDVMKDFVLKLSSSTESFDENVGDVDADDFELKLIEEKPYRTHLPKCKSAPATHMCQAAASKFRPNRKNIKSARERVIFDDKVSVIDVELIKLEADESHLSTRFSRTSTQLSHASARIPSRSSMRSSSSKYQICVRTNSSARCTPLNFDDSLNNINTDFDNLSVCDQLISNVDRKDFIKCLPVHLAKKILSYLIDTYFKSISSVSFLWCELAKQVKADEKYIQAREEDVMMMQSSAVKTPNVSYARRVLVFIPKLDVHGCVKENKEGKHIDVEIIFDEFSDINMEHCYDGLETQRVVMEERNVYCSSYNVFMVESRHENRHISYDGGDLITVGTPDRKIFLVNVKTGDRMKRIFGHSGSVRCLYLNEKEHIAVSGSYDTTIRLWNLKNGKCNIIFLGHQNTVVYLDVSKTYLVSSSSDCVMKIWNLLTGKCLLTLTHSCVIKVVQILGDKIITGTSNGEVLTWNIKTGDTLKTFEGHGKSVTCIKANTYFIFSGSSDTYVKLWNNVGNLYSCLRTYRHPDEVLCLDVSCCRLITGCSDGKIRIWNTLNASCLRVIRGNSKNDPITYLFAFENRIVVNTISAILIYNFEGVRWNYTASREQGKSMAKSRRSHFLDETHPYSYTRAQKTIYHGSLLHKAPLNGIRSCSALEKFSIQNGDTNIRKSRITSAPIRRSSPANLNEQMSNKINRCKSASTLRSESSVDHHISRIKSANNIHVRLKDEKDKTLDKMNSSDRRLKSTIARARCRSAPVQRVIKDLSEDGKGLSTSSFKYTENSTGRNSPLLVSTSKKQVKIQRPKTAISSNVSSLNKFRLRTYYSQLNYEETLQGIRN